MNFFTQEAISLGTGLAEIQESVPNPSDEIRRVDGQPKEGGV